MLSTFTPLLRYGRVRSLIGSPIARWLGILCLALSWPAPAHASISLAQSPRQWVRGQYSVKKVSDTSIEITLTATGAGVMNDGGGYMDVYNVVFGEDAWVSEYAVGVLSSGNTIPMPAGPGGLGGNIRSADFVDCWEWTGPYWSSPGPRISKGNSGKTIGRSWIASGSPGQTVTIVESACFYLSEHVLPSGGNPNIDTYVIGSQLLIQTQTQSYTFGNPAPPPAKELSVVRSEKTKANYAADPVNVTNGEFYNSQVDLRVAGPLPIEVRRNYSSRNTATSEFGNGWLGGYTSYLQVSADLTTIRGADNDGSIVLLRRQGVTDVWTANCADNPEMTDFSSGSSNLLNSRIERTVDMAGTPVGYTWRLPDGSSRYYRIRQFPFTVSGATSSNEAPYLESLSDNRGNSLQFIYGTNADASNYGRIVMIQSSIGHSVELRYDGGGYVSTAIADDGRSVTYSYSGSNLIGVRLPDSQLLMFEYSPDMVSDLLSKETKPDGRVITNKYDGSRRVVSQCATVDSASPRALVQTAAFDYSVAGQTTMRDAFGKATVYEYSGSWITKVTDPLGHSIVKTWYSLNDIPNGAYMQARASVTDERGLQTIYRYDANANVIRTEITGDLDGDPATLNHTLVITAVYDTLNRPTSTTDASGIITTFTYGDANYPYLPTQLATSKEGAPLRTDRMTYTVSSDGAKGLLSRKIVAFGAVDQTITDYEYNPAGLVTRQTVYTGTSDPVNIITYAYNARGELTEVTDGDGRKTVYTYDAMSRPLTKTAKAENGSSLGTWTTTYTGNGEVASVVGPRTGLVQRYYDGAGRLQQEVASFSEARPDGSGVSAAGWTSTTFVHDYFGNLTSVTDPLGNVTTCTYDDIGQLLFKSTAGLRTESYLYEPGGKVSQYTNPLGGITRSFYTSTGQLRRQENPDGSILEWRYYIDGRLAKEILRNGSYWNIVYDDVARTVTRTLINSSGSVLAITVNEFDLRGNLVRSTDSEGYVRTTTYDGLNRPKISTGPAAVAGSAQEITTTTYGASSKTLSVTNALDESSTTIADALGRPVLSQVKSAAGAVIRSTSYAYSADGNAVTVTEGTGAAAISRTIYTDPAGHQLLTVFADGTFTRNSYDLLGNLVASFDVFGQATTYTYNALNQATSQTLPDGLVTNFTYDAAGNLLTRGMAGGALTHEQTFDNAGRKLTERLYAGTTNTRQFSYEYYPGTSPWVGLLKTVTGPRDTVTTTYDDFLRPQTITTAGALPETNGTTTYAYDTRGLATSVLQTSVSNAAGPATQVARTYDGYGHTMTETVTVGGQVFSSATQTWGAAGLRASLDVSGSTLPSPLIGYGYRADGLLTQVTANAQNYGFAYADSGLPTTRTSPFRSFSINSRDALGRILQQTGTVGATPALVEIMTYRADGLLNSYGAARTGAGAWNESRPYTYNSRGQLVSEGFSPVAGASTALTYAFDNNTVGLGVRTDARIGSGAPLSWESRAATVNTLARVTQDQNNNPGRFLLASGLSLGADHVDILVDGVAQGRAQHPGWADPTGAWSLSLNLQPGAHTLKADAVHPSGQYTATATSTFTVAAGGTDAQAGTVTSDYDADGNVTSRTWASGKVQILTWDAFGRLIKVVQRDGASNGFDWTAVYDPLGRRLKSTQQTVTAGVATGTAAITTSTFDPQVEFLEIGVALNGAKAWKVYGPDLNGRYGGLQGTGGLEATIVDATKATKGVLSDRFGNGVGSISSGAVTWFATRVGGYGPLPGSAAETLIDITRVAEATAWRGRRIDPTGFYNLGARYYEPTSGRFLSADPLGHGSSMSLYDFCSGDPVNGFDPDGRCKNDPLSKRSIGEWTSVNGKLVRLPPGSIQDDGLGVELRRRDAEEERQKELDAGTFIAQAEIRNAAGAAPVADQTGLADEEIRVDSAMYTHFKWSKEEYLSRVGKQMLSDGINVAMVVGPFFVERIFAEGAFAAESGFIPRGFSSSGQFAQASGELEAALARSGITDAQIGVRGSSITGFSARTGAPFRAASDIDFFVESGQLTEGFSTSRNIPGFVHPDKILGSYPELEAWSSRWTNILGRDVTPGAFTPGSLSGTPMPQPILWIK